MPRLGAHMSIAGGVDRAILRGEEVGCETIQIFTKSSNQLSARPLDPGEIERFLENRKRTGIQPVFAHDAYLINLCAKESPLLERSRDAFEAELRRAEALGLSYLVMHPGSAGELGEREGLRRVAESLNIIFGRLKSNSVTVLLEVTAGQGTQVGWRFEHLREILDQVKGKDRVGVCMDTCHLFAAGYDMRDEKGYHRTLDEFDKIVGISRIKAFHLNDSKRPLGSRVDRHEHIGKGYIGKKVFELLLNDPRFLSLPMVLETPKDEEMKEDRMNLKTLRRLLRRGPAR